MWLEPDDTVSLQCLGRTMFHDTDTHVLSRNEKEHAKTRLHFDFPSFQPHPRIPKNFVAERTRSTDVSHETFIHAVVTMAVLREGSAFKADLHTTASSKNITVFQRPRRHKPRRKQRMILKQYNPTGMPHRNRLDPLQSKIGRSRLFLGPHRQTAWNATDRGDTDAQKKRKQR